MNFYETVLEVLKQDQRFFAEDGTFLRNAVYEAAMQMDADLIKLLLSNDETKKRFFKDVEGIQVFDKVGFGWVINNRQFLPDSYTRFKNKIGLSGESGELLSGSGKVELVFPYKDCVLEGGQTKDEQEREEVFFNETLAPDEVDRLLYPKVFCDAKRYTTSYETDFAGKPVKETILVGEEPARELLETENLIIKGNNLFAISSLLKRYEHKIKCIYIDPPYNTGSDSFGYNDRFNHSTWLVFMENRLTIAKRLLNNEGVIFVHCDDNEQAYLKVLMDEIFGPEAFVETITVVNNPRGRDYGGIANMHEFMHVYAVGSHDDSLYNIVDPEKKFPYQDAYGGYETRELRNRNTAFHIGNRPNLCYPFYVNPDKEVDNGFLEISLEPKDGFVEVMPAKSMGIQTVWRWGKEKSAQNLNVNIVGKKMREEGRYMIVEKYRDNSQMARSVWWDKEVNSERGTIHLRELFGEKVFNFPKPEELIKRVIEIGTKKGDIILDFHLGSGTTATTAHKMGRQYIGVEQMDYIETVTIERLKKVMMGEDGGISKAVNWQGGGSFVYCKLAQLNQSFVDEIEAAIDEKTLKDIYDSIIKSGFISYKINPSAIDEAVNDFEELSFDDKKRFLMEILDKNLLYVNYCDIDDEEFSISEEDKAFTRSFYRER